MSMGTRDLNDEHTFYDKDALLYRLCEGLAESRKEVVFVVGAPLTAPHDNQAGVADVDGVVEMIRNEFIRKPGQIAQLDNQLSGADNRYQVAFDFLSGRAGQDAANKIIKHAVFRAVNPQESVNSTETLDDLIEDQLRSLDNAPQMWHLSPAVTALGALAAGHPSRFGRTIITSNFDPLIEGLRSF